MFFQNENFLLKKTKIMWIFFFFFMIKFYILCVWSQLKISVGKYKFACVRPSGKNILKIFFFHVWNWEEKWESGEKRIWGTNVLINSKHSLKPNFFSPLGFHTWKLSFLIPKNTIVIFTPKKNWGTFKDFASIFLFFFSPVINTGDKML